MYGKLFASTFTGSLCGSGPNVFAVWSYVVANTFESSVELNPRLLAGVLGTDAESVRQAIDYLCQPDPDSRNPDHDGRRLIRDGQYQYRVVSHAIYRAMRDEEALRAYNREKQRESRVRRGLSNLTSMTVNDCQSTSSYTDTDTEVHTEVRTVEVPEVRTVRNTSVSTATNGNGDGHSERRGVERRQGNGANEPGTLPRDHAQHTICGGPAAKFCLTYNQFDRLATRYRGDTPDATRAAIQTFYENTLTKIPDDKLAGDMVWLLQHFDAWLVDIGRVAPAPSKKKPKQEIDLAQIEREINEEKAAKQARARR